MKTTFQKIYETLRHNGAFKNQAAAADALNLSAATLSKMLLDPDNKNYRTIPRAAAHLLVKKFSVSSEWLYSDGKTGDILVDVSQSDNNSILSRAKQNDIDMTHHTLTLLREAQGNITTLTRSNAALIDQQSSIVKTIADLSLQLTGGSSDTRKTA